MSKIFALLAILLTLSGALLLAVPRHEAANSPRLSPMPESVQVSVPPYILKARDFAEQVNAPLSILFGLVSLFYSRRSYYLNKARAEADKTRAA